MMMDQGTERFTHNFVLFKRPEWWKYNWQAQQSGQTIILDQEQQNLWETQENLGWRKRSALFCQKSFFLHFTCILPIFDAHPFCLFPHYPARTLRALGLLWGSYGKNRIFLAKNRDFGPKKTFTIGWTPCSGHDREKLFKEKSCLCPNNQGGNVILGDFLG